ncbi:helix-turn-helix transcriptional regulator [Erysipelothrix urinaevulpis]|uniref:helix-turn-helix domain-containing protein n=1 Tax=Erysipelothrix urinaevulpis TaxID=2683717 RepID=UPI0013577973|nr:helix-turn-helix transcriptional regulator [Erysipelothrix urinaevulpis]
MTFQELLKKNNMTNYRLHKNTGIHESVIGNWVNNKRDPLRMPFEHAFLISKEFGLSMEELFLTLSSGHEKTEP